MQELLDSFPSSVEIRDFLNLTSTWWQVGILLAGMLLAKLIGSGLQKYFQTLVQTGIKDGIGRTALRTAMLALVPLLLWLWLVTAHAILHKRGEVTTLLYPAMILAGALAVIRMGVFALRHSFSPGSKLKAWEGVLTVTIWTLVALHILGWLPYVEQMLDEYAFIFGKVRISLYNVISFVLSIALMLLVALWLTSAIRDRVTRSEALDDSMKLALAKLIKFVLLTLAVLLAMITAGIDITALTVFGGALGVGLGLGLQRVVSNFVSGFILAFEGSIRLGDVISFGNTFGTVKALHARHVVIHTRDGMDILVPNENLMTSDITNWSYEGDRRIRLRLLVQIGYDDDTEQAITLLEQTAHQNKQVLSDPAPTALVTGFGDNGINLELMVWIEDPEHSGDVRSQLYRQIAKTFKATGISLPFPQREIYIKEAAGIFPRAAKSDSPEESAHDRKPKPKAKPPG